MTMTEKNWEAWRGMVLREIERQNKHLDNLEDDNKFIAVEIGKLKQIACICGAVSAAAMAVVFKILFGG